MKKINGIALTEKNVLKTAVRNAIKSKDNTELNPALTELGYEFVEDKNAYVLTREDQNGNLVHTVLTMTISTKHPSDLAERKPKAKKSTENQEVEVE